MTERQRVPPGRRPASGHPTHRRWLLVGILFVAGCGGLVERGVDGLFNCACTCIGAPFGLALWTADKAAKGAKHLDCGVCPSGQACNPGYDPPRCRPTPGAAGEFCKNAVSGLGDGDYFPCAKGLECNHETRKCDRPGASGP